MMMTDCSPTATEPQSLIVARARLLLLPLVEKGISVDGAQEPLRLQVRCVDDLVQWRRANLKGKKS
jgi:hypothetical protein